MLDLHDSISTAFNAVTTATSRFLRQKFYVSWLRRSGSNAYGIVGTSAVNNCLVRGESSVVSPVDTFDFFDESERVLSLEYDRRLNEPLGGISFCILNAVLNNTDLRFTPEHNSTIGTALLPNRPVKMSVGFYVNGVNRLITVFKGLSDSVKETKENRQVEFSGFDYLSFLDKYEMDEAVYANQRGDQIIEDILNTVGFGTSQYSLDQSLNTIPFAWFESSETAGARIKKICEAEEATCFQDEDGVIRFENRRKFSSYSSIVWTFKSDDIMGWENLDDIQIINNCIVQATPRSVQASQELWRESGVIDLAIGETKEIYGSISDPVSSYVTPVSGTDYVANSASNGTGDDLTANISLVFNGYAKEAKFSLTNNGIKKAYITLLKVRGTPATEASTIEERYLDQPSIDKYGKKTFTIQNDFIQDRTFAYYLARAIVNKYKVPLKRIRILVRGVPRLQLKDKVQVYDRDVSALKTYRVMGIQGSYGLGEFTQYLTLREVTSGEADDWAVVGTALVSGSNAVVGI